MSYDPGALESALAAAVGDDPALMAELRRAFLDSARRHFEALETSATAGEWQVAAWRLKGLAASFGATDLMVHAEQAAEGAPLARDSLRRLARAIGGFEEDTAAD